MSSTDQAALNGAGIERFTGRWVGAGAGHFHTIDDFEYSEEIEFAPTPKPFTCAQHRVVSSNCWSASPPDSSRSIAAPSTPKALSP